MKFRRHIEILKLYFKEAKNKNCRQKVRRIIREIKEIDKKYGDCK